MEAAAAGIAARGPALPASSSSQPSRKQWRAVPEHSARILSNEELERSKLGQSDERLIYEVQQGREPADVDFCSITIDGSLHNDILQQRLNTLVKQREEFQQMEVELRAQLIARTEIIEMQNTFDAQIKEHVSANVKLQEQLRVREQKIVELERRMEEKERELNVVRRDSEAAWVKEDLLREQSKELQSYRRERDNSEAERSQHIKQINELQEHIQEKERQFMELQEQNRIAQETVIYKDEQLRETQNWISRVQEMDALQSSTNHSLQAELRERTEQYNQLWLGCRQQCVEMERLHLHIQQLQLELAEARKGMGQENSNDVPQPGHNNGGQVDASGNNIAGGNSGGLPNCSSKDASSFVSGESPSKQIDHGFQMAPSSLLGMPSYLPPGQMTALHPFVIHQQGVPQSVPSHIPQGHVNHFHSVPVMSALQQWPNQQTASEGSPMPTGNQYSLQSDNGLLRSESNNEYGTSVNGHIIRPDYLDVNLSQGMKPSTVVSSSSDGREVFESMDKNYYAGAQSQKSMQQISSQFNDVLRLNPHEHKSENKENDSNLLPNHDVETVVQRSEQPSSNADLSLSETSAHDVNFSASTVNANSNAVVSEAFSSTGQIGPCVVGKLAESPLLDERSLLACIVRTFPPGSGGRIRISSTLPNRLGKMLAPLHWHDYKKKYGKLDDFVASHPELFEIEGDYIQLKEGAQEIIAATAAVAKLAAAAATSSHSSFLPSVAVTPMAQSHRLKKALSIESTSSGKTDNSSHLSDLQNQHLNGVPLHGAGGVSNVKILSKPKDHMQSNGSGQCDAFPVANGTNTNRNELATRSKISVHGRPVEISIGKQQGR